MTRNTMVAELEMLTPPDPGRPLVAVAGATGHCGLAVVRQAREKGLRVRVLVRNRNKLQPVIHLVDEIAQVQVTREETLQGVLGGCRYLVSAVGKTRQKDSITRQAVDVDANLNLFDEARRTRGLERIAFVSVFGADPNSPVAMLRMKGEAEAGLACSGCEHVIIRPTGYFSDMEEILEMARSGSLLALGGNKVRLNPIGLGDLGGFVIKALLERSGPRVRPVGGPEVFTWAGLADLCSRVLGRPVKTRNIPLWLVNGALPLLRPFSRDTWEVAQFMAGSAALLQRLPLPPAHGSEKLENHFREYLSTRKTEG